MICTSRARTPRPFWDSVVLHPIGAHGARARYFAGGVAVDPNFPANLPVEQGLPEAGLFAVYAINTPRRARISSRR